MKFLVDECLSHLLVRDFAARGYPDAVHPLNVGMSGSRDDTILAKAIAEDRIVVTANVRDYRRLMARVPLHPGGLLIEPLDRLHAWQLILVALAFIELQPIPVDYMVNRVIEVSAAGAVVPYEL